mmetsp:Transcript_25815/g.81504  ORF Transcript_25815/g.81504 Transcript_25815/m.81504 type:complete len:297 (+) Transcript_25815:757-1647(+)
MGGRVREPPRSDDQVHPGGEGQPRADELRRRPRPGREAGQARAEPEQPDRGGHPDARAAGGPLRPRAQRGAGLQDPGGAAGPLRGPQVPGRPGAAEVQRGEAADAAPRAGAPRLLPQALRHSSALRLRGRPGRRAGVCEAGGGLGPGRHDHTLTHPGARRLHGRLRAAARRGAQGDLAPRPQGAGLLRHLRPRLAPPLRQRPRAAQRLPRRGHHRWLAAGHGRGPAGGQQPLRRGLREGPRALRRVLLRPGRARPDRGRGEGQRPGHRQRPRQVLGQALLRAQRAPGACRFGAGHQ